MPGQSPVYPERVYSSNEGRRGSQISQGASPGGISPGWMLAGLAGVGLAAWMVWHFGPDIARYIKMERM